MILVILSVTSFMNVMFCYDTINKIINYLYCFHHK